MPDEDWVHSRYRGAAGPHPSLLQGPQIRQHSANSPSGTSTNPYFPSGSVTTRSTAQVTTHSKVKPKELMVAARSKRKAQPPIHRSKHHAVKYRTVNESRRVYGTPLTSSVTPPTAAGSLQQQVDSPVNTAVEAVDVKPASAEKDWITRLRGRLADSENPDRPAAVAEGVDKLAGSGKQSPAAGKAVAAAVAEVMPFEQMAYRDEYSFFRNFLSFPRDERQQILQDAFLNPKTEAEKTRLNDIVELINTANTPDEKKAALGALNQNWNSIMTRIEQDYPDQNPTDITLGPDVLSVVLGGKRTSGLHGAGDQLVEQLLEQEDSEVMSFSRSEGSVNDDLKSKRHTHFTSQTSLLEAVAREKGPSTRVVFFYTIGLTGDNGQNEVNNTMVDDLITSFIDRGWLIDPNVFIVHTSTYHASAQLGTRTICLLTMASQTMEHLRCCRHFNSQLQSMHTTHSQRNLMHTKG